MTSGHLPVPITFILIISHWFACLVIFWSGEHECSFISASSEPTFSPCRFRAGASTRCRMG